MTGKKKSTRKRSKQPAHQAGKPRVSPSSGVAPPVEHQWKPGQSGNPAGRPSAGASVREWMDVMQDWTTPQIRAVLEDPAAPASKQIAAKVWVDAIADGGSDFDRIMDRTEGKPKQSIDLKADVTATHTADIHAAMDVAFTDPEVFAAAELIAEKLDALSAKPNRQ